MKLCSILYGATLVIVTAAITSTVVSQDKPKPPDKGKAPGGMPDAKQQEMQKEMEKKWGEFRTPGEAHKALNFKVGKWDGAVKMWDPNQPNPRESTCTSEVKWIMDGRYLSDNTEGSFNGETFMGHGLSGYDNLKKRYAWVWIDNFGTGFMNAEGTYDAGSKTFKYTFEQPDLMAGKYAKARSVERVIDNDHWAMEMYAPGPDGKEYKNFEITYTRAK